MASFSASKIFNAGQRDPKVPRQVVIDGERRAEKYPSGVTERVIDLQGNVMQRVLVPPGVQATQDLINAARNRMHLERNGDKSVQGVLEHGKCPIKHGFRYLTPMLEDEFTAMPVELQRPCADDPETVTVKRGQNGRPSVREYHDACPHAEWLIASRKEREAVRRASRRTNSPDFAAQQLEVAKQQAEETRQVNQKLVAVMEQVAAGSNKRKASDA